jgi:hypothetical protein
VHLGGFRDKRSQLRILAHEAFLRPVALCHFWQRQTRAYLSKRNDLWTRFEVVPTHSRSEPFLADSASRRRAGPWLIARSRVP